MNLIEKAAYGGWENCYRISNGNLEMVITADVGPRIIQFGFSGQGNEFFVDTTSLGKSGGNEWRVYGGHRLWIAPEDRTTTYSPDNEPLTVDVTGNTIKLIQAACPLTGIQKTLEIKMSTGSNQVAINHHLQNLSEQDIVLAPWAITVMAAGGTAILPLPQRGLHPRDLLPTSSLTLWPYTDMRDGRWFFGFDHIMLKQDSSAALPQKIGMLCPDGWAAFANRGHLFIKTFLFDPAVSYADLGCNVEIFTDNRMTEMESLGPLKSLKPGESVQHVEYWYLFQAPELLDNEGNIYSKILPIINSALNES